VKRQKVKGKRQKFVLMLCIFCVSVVNCVAQNLDSLAEKIHLGSAEEKREALYQIRNLQTAEASRIAIPALQDANEIIRATATHSVIFLPSDEAAQILLPLLSDKSFLVRKEAAYALGKTRKVNAVQLLLDLLQRDKILEVKTASVVALGEIGEVSAVEVLLGILRKKPKDEEEFLRRAAARSIGQIAQFQQVKEIYMTTPESPLPEKYDVLVNRKYSNLAENFPSFRQAVGILLTVLQNPKEADDVKREAAFALGAIGDAGAVEKLGENLNAKDYYLAEICRESLFKLRMVADSYR
jgi:HEAT repeat protein